jgi:peroxiredoxin
MKQKPKWPIILAVVVVGTCLLVCLGVGAVALLAPSIYQFSLNQSSLEVGTLAPDFEAAALSGDTIRLSQYHGEPVLLTFGTTWCPDCRLEAPIVQELHENHPELVVLLVDSNESAGIVQEFVDEFGITYPVLMDHNGSISRQYQIFAIPTGLFIDSDGVIRAKIIESVTPELLAEKLLLIGVYP